MLSKGDLRRIITLNAANASSSASLEMPPMPLARFTGSAAVLVPLIERKDGWYVLLTKRATTMRTHAGEVCFPGGRVEGSESVVDAALREAEEEIGLTSDAVDVLGRLDFVQSKNDLLVAPVIALVDESRFKPRLNLSEVDCIFAAPLTLFQPTDNLAPDFQQSFYKFPHTTTAMAASTDRVLAPEEFVTFGLTAIVLMRLMQLVRAPEKFACRDELIQQFEASLQRIHQRVLSEWATHAKDTSTAPARL
jgi:8-oxo-dGTP pyrophosphatase MutT (NUDIX family)